MLGNIIAGVAKLTSGILTGRGALVYHGYLTYFDFIEVAALNGSTETIYTSWVLNRLSYFPVNRLDFKNFLEPSKYNSSLLVPTVERALVDFMLDQAIDTEDEDLMYALQVYNKEKSEDFSKLLEVASFYDVRPAMEQAISISKTWDKFDGEG